MRLSTIYDEAIQHSDRLVQLYDLLVTRNKRAIRQDWSDRFYAAQLTAWPKSKGLWRSYGEHLLIVGTAEAGVSHQAFTSEALLILLRSSLVLAMAAVDKILHEAVSKRFVDLVKRAKLDDTLKLEISTSYRIAMDSRARRGRGGNIRSRPGPRFKTAILAKLYRETFLSPDKLQKISAACGKSSVLAAYGKSPSPPISAEQAKKVWSQLYGRRNAIAHESDIVRKTKARKVHFQPVTGSELRRDIEWIRAFGQYLAAQLD